MDPAAQYPVVTNNFVATGGDFYATIASGIHVVATGEPLDKAVSDYIATFSPVSALLAGAVSACHRVCSCTRNT